MKDANIDSPVIMTAGLIVTYACNLHCTYCYETRKKDRFMTLQTAKEILGPLLMQKAEPLQVMLMGGEPLLAFEMIQETVEWVLSHEERWTRRCSFFASTNGTLLDDPMKEWFHAHRHAITLALSYDGLPLSQDENRSASADKIDLAFFQRNWPEQRVQMTISERTVGQMAEGVIFLLEKGFQVNPSVAYEGTEWSGAAVNAYLGQLLLLKDYYLAHPPAPLIYPFRHPLTEYAAALKRPTVQRQQCGAGCGFFMFDIDKKRYPCHMMSPLVLSDAQLAQIEGTDMRSMDLQDERCIGCPYVCACPACAGCNYVHRGDMARRDSTHCRIQQIEVMACMRYWVSRIQQDPAQGSRELVDAIRKLNAYICARARI